VKEALGTDSESEQEDVKEKERRRRDVRRKKKPRDLLTRSGTGAVVASSSTTGWSPERSSLTSSISAALTLREALACVGSAVVRVSLESRVSTLSHRSRSEGLIPKHRVVQFRSDFTWCAKIWPWSLHVLT